VTPLLRLLIMSMLRTVSLPLYQPQNFSKRTRDKKAGIAISSILAVGFHDGISVGQN
jgi:hypothetical protein